MIKLPTTFQQSFQLWVIYGLHDMQSPNWGRSSSSSPTFPAHSQAEIFFFPEFGVALGYVPLARALTRSAGVLPACRLLRTRNAKPAKDVKAAFYLAHRSKN
jgi:hypothetical protein